MANIIYRQYVSELTRTATSCSEIPVFATNSLSSEIISFPDFSSAIASDSVRVISDLTFAAAT